MKEEKFVFERNLLDLKKGKAVFFYRLEKDGNTQQFKEEIEFNPEEINISLIEKIDLSPIMNSLHLVLGMSYWKIYCPKIIETESMNLTEEMAEFWNVLYTKGMGEFFYKNKIDYRNLVKFPYKKNKIERIKKQTKDRSLVLFGGGKDSIVTGEILKKNKKDFSLFIVNSSKVQDETAKIMGNKKILFKRKIDQNIFEFNKRSNVYNGHIPVTAIWEFLAIFAAIIYDYRYVIASCEASANYGNVEYLGNEMNHQWSKSEEYEKLVQKYVKKFISEDIIPFSLLRPFQEIQITEIFSRYSQYFLNFSSCNKNFKIENKENMPGRWCGKCPKCLFVFIILSAFLDTKTLLNIFDKNLYRDESLTNLLNELLGNEGFKPFECVGTPEETLSALTAAYKSGQFDTDALMDYFIRVYNFKNLSGREPVMASLQRSEILMPGDFFKMVKNI